jgi:hypothetical protein
MVGLTKMEGLERLTELRALYLQENLFGQIEGLNSLIHLDTLNLAQVSHSDKLPSHPIGKS